MNHIALIFSGQGAQHTGMGKDLAAASTTARELYHEADSLLGVDFSQTCFEGPEERLTETRYCQPALYVHGLALLAVLKNHLPSFHFTATAGLSLGEFTAHCAAGHISFRDGLQLVAERGKLMQEACNRTQGGMLTLIGATPEQAIELARRSGLEVANYNCPGQVVLSGPKSLIPATLEHAKSLSLKRALPLNVAGAYHSSLMLTAQDGLAPHLDAATISANNLATYSNVTARPATTADEIRATLLQQVTASVRWQACIEQMIADGTTLFIELGPGKVLAGMCKRINNTIPCLSIGSLEELEGIIHEIPQ